MKFKPMLACEFKKEKAIYPYLATPKIDGIRCLIRDGQAVSRSLKPIRNSYISKCLSSLPDGLDGELTSGDTFQTSTSSIMSADGNPNFIYWVFDYVDDPAVPYKDRVNKLIKYSESTILPSFVRILTPMLVLSESDLENYMTLAVEQGHEGVILRSLESPYKFGRSTNKENYLLKVKTFCDSEAVVTGFQEKLSNNNPQEVNALGYSERSSHKENLVQTGTLGALLVKDKVSGVTFKIGTGFNDELRQQIWNNQSQYMNTLVKYKYMPHGEKDKPRHPTFLGFRDQDDL
jgi:DNA ligase-1